MLFFSLFFSFKCEALRLTSLFRHIQHNYMICMYTKKLMNDLTFPDGEMTNAHMHK